MDKPDPNLDPREVVNQALEAPPTGCGTVSKGTPECSPTAAAVDFGQRADAECKTAPLKGDVLVLTHITPSLTYNALYLSLRNFGTVCCIKLVFDDQTCTNTGYVTFASYDEAKTAFNSFQSLPFTESRTKANLIRSANLTEDDDDYYPNLFAGHGTEIAPRARQEPPPSWFIAYYKGGRGNYFRAVKQLEVDFGTFPEGHLKQYGKGVLIHAKTVTQSQMLLHQSCPPDSMFEAIKPHRTFIIVKGVYTIMTCMNYLRRKY